MSERDIFSQVQLDVRAGSAPTTARPADDTPFHVAVVGDFGGRAAGDLGAIIPVRDRRPLRVDRDDLDDVLARLAPELDLEVGAGEPLRISFTSLEDFHPDRLVSRLPIFASLRDLRARLADPRTSPAALAALTGPGAPTAPSAGTEPDGTDLAGLAPVGTPPAGSPAGDGERGTASMARRLASGSLLDEIVAASPDVAAHSAPAGEARAGEARAGGGLGDFLNDIVRPYLVRDPDPRQQELLAGVDAATSALLRAILSHPRFRELEALWRGLELMVRRIETGSTLRLAILDLTPQELAAAVPAGRANVGDSPLHHLLTEGASIFPELAPWSLLVGLHPPRTATDVPLLDGLARVAAAAGAPWIGAAPGELAIAGAEPPDGWGALRASPHAPWLGLVHPPILLRLPYGEEGDPCDTIRFEELEPVLGADAATGALLWGSAALVPAIMICASFAEHGWRMRPGSHPGVDRLPLYVHRDAAGAAAIPPVRWLLDSREMDRLLETGVMALAADGGGDTVQPSRLQGVAAAAAGLAGRWVVGS